MGKCEVFCDFLVPNFHQMQKKNKSKNDFQFFLNAKQREAKKIKTAKNVLITRRVQKKEELLWIS